MDETSPSRKRYSYESQIEYLRGLISLERAMPDEDSEAHICMYNSLLESVHRARAGRLV